MGSAIRWWGGAPALAGALLVAASAGAEVVAKAPPNGALLGGTPARFIGMKTEGEKARVEVLLNGQPAAGLKEDGVGFSVPLALQAGTNRVTLRAGTLSRELTYEYQPQAAGGYRYHPPVAEGDCKSCHPQGAGRTSPVSDAKLCRVCHDPVDKVKYLHGPVGAGQCTICHDPHGSSQPGLLVAAARALCLSCHDQSSTRTHTEGSAGRRCTECHNPHGSGKSYLLY